MMNQGLRGSIVGDLVWGLLGDIFRLFWASSLDRLLVFTFPLRRRSSLGRRERAPLLEGGDKGKIGLLHKGRREAAARKDEQLRSASELLEIHSVSLAVDHGPKAAQHINPDKRRGACI